MSAGRHPKNAINAVLTNMDSPNFLVVEIHRGHRWGLVRCLVCNGEVSIWSTPRVPENNARDIVRFIARHEHEGI